MRSLIAGCLLGVAAVGCGSGGDGGQPSTQATPVTYPSGFPLAVTAAPGATWFQVNGLADKTMYTATLSVSQPGPNVDLEVYSTFEPTPPNLLCASNEDTFTESCSFGDAAPRVYIMLLNKGATPPSAGFATGPADVTLGMMSP